MITGIVYLRSVMCATLVGFAVKIMDDWLDESFDESMTDRVSPGIGPGVLPYALLSLCLAVPFEPFFAVALFLMCYSVGMIGRTRDAYPSGLRGWQESALAVAACVAACGLRLTLVAALSISGIQGFDDVMDYRASDPPTGPVVHRFGVVETILASAAFLLMAMSLDLARTCAVVVAVLVVWGAERALRR